MSAFLLAWSTLIATRGSLFMEFISAEHEWPGLVSDGTLVGSGPHGHDLQTGAFAFDGVAAQDSIAVNAAQPLPHLHVDGEPSRS